MFCSKCGAMLPDGSKFCTSCGCVLSTEPVPEKEPAKKEKKPVPKKFIILGIIGVLVVGVLALVINSYSQTADMRKALKNNDARAITSTYFKESDQKLIAKYDELIVEKIDEIIDFLNDNDYTEAAKSNDYVFDDACETEPLLMLTQSENTGYDIFFCENVNTAAKFEELEDLMNSNRRYYAAVNDFYELGDSVDADDYEVVLQNLMYVDENDKHYEDAVELKNQCVNAYWDSIKAEVEDSGDDINYIIQLLKSAKEFLASVGADTSEVDAKIEATVSDYAKLYADLAEKAFKEKDAAAALANINIALELEDNGTYRAKKDEYTQYLPYELYNYDNVLMTKGYGAGCESSCTANDGTTFEHAINWDGHRDSDDYATWTYNLEGKYDVVTGTLYLLRNCKDTEHVGYFEAWGDGKKLYTSPKITAGVLPQDISFSIKNVQRLEIRFCGSDYYGGTPFAVSDLIAQKAFPESE